MTRAVDAEKSSDLLCPSAQPDMPGAFVLGVVEGTVEEPRVAYLDVPQPWSEELLPEHSDIVPTEVFRFAAPCAGHGCRHFDGSHCALAERSTRLLSPVVERLPPCAIRPRCRWFAEQGKHACERCPMVVTSDHRADALAETVAYGGASEK